ncbi:peptidoglycan-binding domain-containing protein [Methanosphaera sp.]|uniref:peptidoglycan-binding domain-containing protein n=1 Tax=Methanosphaera sp. TaxID=2666342 RepID=UPI0025FC51DA|nr:peptidoglycan-binding domain-containing protein [Methanosphaera sp.]
MTIDCNKVNIKKNSTGTKVKELQKYLTYCKFYDGKIDGKCGDYTVNAIKKLQKELKVKIDGNFGPITCKASSINGKDVSKTNMEIPLKIWKDMMSRFEKYVKENKTEPKIIYIDKENPYEHVTLEKYKDLKTRYDTWIKNNGKEPNILYMNKTENTKINTTQPNNTNTTTFTVSHLCEKQGGNCLGQITGYHCGPHSIKQALRKFGITKYTEATIAGYAGTTTAGTGHGGLETAIATIAKKEGINLKVEWKNFSDLGPDQKSRFKKLGELMTDPKKAVFWHEMYRDAYGHYSLARTINISTMYGIIANSLGNKCNSPAYCGYMENRKLSDQARYLSKISQKSICIITKA